MLLPQAILASLKAESRFALSPLPLTADALALARLGLLLNEQKRTLTVVCASAQDASRLTEEIKTFAPALKVHQFPDWETLPYDTFSPHQDLVSERLLTLYQMSQRDCDIVLVPATTALYRLAPAAYLAGYTFFLKQGQKLDEAKLKSQLSLAGYNHVSQVMAPGEYAVRGGLIDLFPMGSTLPYRIDLFGDEIETIRTFDVDTQRSIYAVKDIRLLPGREFPLDDKARTAFRGKFRETFEGDPSKSPVYKDIGLGIATAGIEYYLPLFFETTATLFDYLPADAVIALHGNIEAAAADFWKETNERYRYLKSDIARPCLPPGDLFLSGEQFFLSAKNYSGISLKKLDGGGSSGETPEDLSKSGFFRLPAVGVNARADDPLAVLRGFAQGFKGRVLVVAESAGRRETITTLCAEHGVKLKAFENYTEFAKAWDKLCITVAPFEAGFIAHDAEWNGIAEPLALITEAELYAVSGSARRAQRSVRKDKRHETNVDGMLKDLTELQVGDAVVHTQHGIGRYEGLIELDLGGDEKSEFLHLTYAEGAILYVPVTELHVISRYSGGSQETAPLHRLGSGQWEKAKRRAAIQVRDTAAELLNLYARRAARQGHAFEFSMHDYQAFAEGFGFDETPDQAQAIQSVLDDMRSNRPMDRLICGDVGFGKTEVALRAAFAAVAGGKQVAILAPTTLLAEQHFHTFSDRFADFPVKIAELSRFRSGKEITASIKGLKDATVDIAIGTHKLVGKDVAFKNLGLVIIDEEHRFGVRQKEALKALRAEVDVLTLTATPIPRTLAMSLEGLREFSIIATAPQKRLSIKTFVRRETDGIIREAALRELKRGGQVYYLYNEVETIQNMYDRLTRLLPEARIAIAHGQMGERDLERVMHDFYQQRFNILLCTTIIETGIDVPSANTILMHRADRFGLAQLHQLRGRVGRSHHQAYAYLLVNDTSGLTPSAKKRLDAIQSMEDLGSGFYLAMHDLEIRGAGEVLGDSQSGEMQEVGFSLYTEMLAHAVACLKVGKEPDLSQPLGVTTQINLHTPALLPSDYCGDVHERLTIYKRFANAQKPIMLERLTEELIDRFGPMPPQTQALVDTHRLRIAAQVVGITKIDAGPDSMTFQFMANPPVDAAKIIALVQRNRNYAFAGQDRIKVAIKTDDAEAKVREAKLVLKALSP